MFIGTILFSILTGVDTLLSLGMVLSNPKNILLALSMAMIPILGGIMLDSGMMIELVRSMNVPKKVALMVSPALFGLLPMLLLIHINVRRIARITPVHTRILLLKTF